MPEVAPARPKRGSFPSPSSSPPKWYNVLLLVAFFAVLFVVGMFWIGPW